MGCQLVKTALQGLAVMGTSSPEVQAHNYSLHIGEEKKSRSTKNKWKLKGPNMVITENIRKLRLLLYRKACEKFCFKEVWSGEGRISMKLNSKVNDIDHKFSFN